VRRDEGGAVNAAFNYPKYFSMIPLGPTPKPTQTEGFFDIAIAQDPKPQTVAIVAADAEFPINSSEGARERQSGRRENRLRQAISASDYRLRAGRESDPGGQSGPRRPLLLSAGLSLALSGAIHRNVPGKTPIGHNRATQMLGLMRWILWL
jgi:hypothetical protein